MKKEHPDYTVGQVGKALGEMWKQEPEAVKKVGGRAGGQVADRRRLGSRPENAGSGELVGGCPALLVAMHGLQ